RCPVSEREILTVVLLATTLKPAGLQLGNERSFRCLQGLKGIARAQPIVSNHVSRRKDYNGALKIATANLAAGHQRCSNIESLAWLWLEHFDFRKSRADLLLKPVT